MVVVGCTAKGADGLLIKPADGPGRSHVHHAMGLTAALLTNVQVLPSMVAEEPADSQPYHRGSARDGRFASAVDSGCAPRGLPDRTAGTGTSRPRMLADHDCPGQPRRCCDDHSARLGSSIGNSTVRHGPKASRRSRRSSRKVRENQLPRTTTLQVDPVHRPGCAAERLWDHTSMDTGRTASASEPPDTRPRCRGTRPPSPSAGSSLSTA